MSQADEETTKQHPQPQSGKQPEDPNPPSSMEEADRANGEAGAATEE